MRKQSTPTRNEFEVDKIELYLITVAALGIALLGIITRGLAASGSLSFSVFIGLSIVFTGNVCLTIIFYAHQTTRDIARRGRIAITDVIATMCLAVGAAAVIVTIGEIISTI